MAYTDLYIDAGTDFRSNVDMLADDGTAINVAGYIFQSQIRKSYFSVNATANIVMTIVDGPNGNVTMSMDAANTANIAPGRYVYDILVTNAANVKSRLAEGMLTVTPRVSK